MRAGSVCVIGETPSLGRSIVDLLESDGIPCQYLPEAGSWLTPASEGGRLLLIAASNSAVSPTARRWLRGELPNTDLIVVGSRDPQISFATGIHLLRLPLPPNMFLRYVRDLLAAPGPSAVLPAREPAIALPIVGVNG